eukprot:760924-Hanusia_phi.AAC.1
MEEYKILAQSQDREIAANSVGQIAALQNKMGHHEEAEQSYRRSIAMDPSNAQMRMNLAVILADQQQQQQQEERRGGRRRRLKREAESEAEAEIDLRGAASRQGFICSL